MDPSSRLRLIYRKAPGREGGKAGTFVEQFPHFRLHHVDPHLLRLFMARMGLTNTTAGRILGVNRERIRQYRDGRPGHHAKIPAQMMRELLDRASPDWRNDHELGSVFAFLV
jgi:hypothetical protein